jgi:UDP-N-acetylmuramoylalanine--D-glutamate ligase
MQSTLCGIIGILGFGVDGQTVAEFLEAQPEVKEVRVFDERVTNAEIPFDKAQDRLQCENAKMGTSLDGVDLLFRSPGFPLTHPLVKEAKERGIPITSSTTYFLEHFPGRTIGVTGSNGKTTCSTLIAEMLRAEFGPENVEEGGNDRKPRLDLLTTNYSLPTTHYVVLELSSFQLMDCPYSPNVAVVLNVTPNHLDWHTSMEEYAEAKRQIVAHQGEGDIAILNADDPMVRTFADGLRSTVRFFDIRETINYQLSTINFKSHPSTIRAAVTAARVLGVSEENIAKVLSTFRGVPHRIEFVRELDHVKWYNDSSCTTPESAIVACNAFPVGSLILLLGGRDKGMDFSKLYEVIQERKIRVVPYGEMSETFQKNIPDTYHLKPDTSFEEVIAAARSLAKPGDNVVLSPACTSFDMFKNAKERGKMFETLVKKL